MGRSTHPAEPVSSEHLVLVRKSGRGSAGGHIELVEDVAHMAIDRLDAYEQLPRDCRVGAAARDQAEHLELAGGEPEPRHESRLYSGWGGNWCVWSGGVGGGLALLEHRPGCVTLQLRAFLAPQRLQRVRDYGADPRSDVWRTDMLPRGKCHAQRRECFARRPGRQMNGAA